VDVIGERMLLSSARVATKIGHSGTVVRLVEPDEHLTMTDTSRLLLFPITS